MKYQVHISPEAKIDIDLFRQTGQDSIIKKIDELINELQSHPKTGTGKPKFLKYKKC